MKEPIKPSKEDCCNSGCDPCVFDLYEKQIKLYEVYIKNGSKTDVVEENAISPLEYTSFKVRKEYVRYAKVFPLTETLDFKLPSKWYRRTVGALEILFGLTLALVPGHKIKNAANIGLVALMVLAAYSHVMVGDPFDRCAPALVFFFMLCGRLVVWYQISRREELERSAATQNGNGLKRD